jgi:hypothetical protein
MPIGSMWPAVGFTTSRQRASSASIASGSIATEPPSTPRRHPGGCRPPRVWPKPSRKCILAKASSLGREIQVARVAHAPSRAVVGASPTSCKKNEVKNGVLPNLSQCADLALYGGIIDGKLVDLTIISISHFGVCNEQKFDISDTVYARNSRFTSASHRQANA